MSDNNIEIDAKALSDKLDGAGLTDDEKAVVAYALSTAFASEVEGFSAPSLVGGALVATGAATGMAAGATGGAAMWGLASVAPTINSMVGSVATLNVSKGSVGVKIV